MERERKPTPSPQMTAKCCMCNVQCISYKYCVEYCLRFYYVLTLCTLEIHFNTPFLFDGKNEGEIRDNKLLLLLFLLPNLNGYIRVILKCNPQAENVKKRKKGFFPQIKTVSAPYIPLYQSLKVYFSYKITFY